MYLMCAEMVHFLPCGLEDVDGATDAIEWIMPTTSCMVGIVHESYVVVTMGPTRYLIMATPLMLLLTSIVHFIRIENIV